MSEQPDALVTALRNAARAMTTRRSIRDLDHVLDMIVRSAVESIPHVDAGGISMVQDGQTTARSPTHASITKLDRLQSELDEGPCISAIREPPADGVVVAQDLAGPEGKLWPRFAPQAVEAGFRGLLSTQLAFEGGMRAALNLYATEPDVFDVETRHLAGLFGVQAAVLLYGSEQASHLQHAVDNRDVIGQAKGLLMERFTVHADDAFLMLVHSSQETNIKLVDVARWLTGEAHGRAHPA